MPMNNKFYGNKALHKMLTNKINSESLCHAYLFYGKKGIGKKTLCSYITKAILCKCENKPCNNCSSCTKFDSGNHPDFKVIVPKADKKTVSIDDIREIRLDAYIMPNDSDFKVYIIPNVEKMAFGAFNGLLKVLEEPPKTAIFLLTAESKSVVPQTIISRCIPCEIFPLSDIECMEALDDILVEVDRDKKSEAIAQSNGVLGRAIELLTTEGQQLDIIHNGVIDSIIKVDEYGMLKALAPIKTDRQLFNNLVDELLVTIRAGVLVKFSAKEFSDERQKTLAYSLTTKKAEKLLQVLQKAVEMNNGNASLSLLFNWFTVNIMNIIS